MNKLFHIYRSSAGSGKTRILIKNYLSLALQHGGDYFKHILAVTFTNKSTQEMKERVLHCLKDFSEGTQNDLFEELALELEVSPHVLRSRSKDLLVQILHHYNQFAISTIDTFFQQIIRSFTREAGLLGNFRLEIDYDRVLESTLDELMDELGTNKQLTKWMTEFSYHRLQGGQNWNPRSALKLLSQELFNERFKAVESQVVKPRKNNYYQGTLKRLRTKKKEFEMHMHRIAVSALNAIKGEAITADDFSYKDKGTPIKYFIEFSKKKYYSSSGKRIQRALESPENWYTKSCARREERIAFTEKILAPLLKKMVDYDTSQGITYRSVCSVLQHFYACALMVDVARKLDTYRQENNLMLLSDAPHLIQRIIRDSDTPFLYEKIGTYYHHYLIDEFQDTSAMQWKNFSPLLKEALDQQKVCLLVGDVKQSIYRWRGADAGLLYQNVVDDIGEERIAFTALDVNYRSADIIVKCNNSLFSTMAQKLSDLVAYPFIARAFADVMQQSVRLPAQGCLHISFLKKSEEKKDWKQEALERLPLLLEELQDKKIKLGDIAILTRKNEEGTLIANTLIHYKNTHPNSPYCYDVVSSESLKLALSPAVKIVLSALRYLYNPLDDIARAQLVYQLKKEVPPEQAFHCAANADTMAQLLSEELIVSMQKIKSLPIYELVEELVRLFSLGEDPTMLPYLQAFQDAVLEFSKQDITGIGSFIEWWEEVKDKKTVVLSATENAATILTIHKAKGLQFNYVIMPFLNWNVDHEKSPWLWVTSNKPPFDEDDCFAVRYSKDLDTTYFSESYRLERSNAYLDNLNLLYVAFTRAQYGFFAFAPHPDQHTKGMLHTSSLLHECIHEDEELKKHYHDNKFAMGTLYSPPVKSITISHHASVSARPYHTLSWRKNRIVKKEDPLFFIGTEKQKKDTLYYDSLLRQVFSYIRYQEDAVVALRRLKASMSVNNKDLSILSEEIQKAFLCPEMMGWFEKTWQVSTEVSILLPRHQQPTSALYRVDRVMKSNTKTIVADYRTSLEPHKRDHNIAHYINNVEQGGMLCEGYLIYLLVGKDIRIKRISPTFS